LLQTAQVVDLVENFGVTAQTGWDNSKKSQETEQCMDFNQLVIALLKKRLGEKFFIDLLKNRYPEIQLGSVNVPAAIDFATGNQQSPYTIAEGSTRPRIDERFSKFCARTIGMKGYDKAIERIDRNIVERFESLYGEIPSQKKARIATGMDYSQECIRSKQSTTIAKVDQIQNLMGVI